MEQWTPSSSSVSGSGASPANIHIRNQAKLPEHLEYSGDKQYTRKLNTSSTFQRVIPQDTLITETNPYSNLQQKQQKVSLRAIKQKHSPKRLAPNALSSQYTARSFNNSSLTMVKGHYQKPSGLIQTSSVKNRSSTSVGLIDEDSPRQNLPPLLQMSSQIMTDRRKQLLCLVQQQCESYRDYGQSAQTRARKAAHTSRDSPPKEQQQSGKDTDNIIVKFKRDFSQAQTKRLHQLASDKMAEERREAFSVNNIKLGKPKLQYFALNRKQKRHITEQGNDQYFQGLQQTQQIEELLTDLHKKNIV